MPITKHVSHDQLSLLSESTGKFIRTNYKWNGNYYGIHLIFYSLFALCYSPIGSIFFHSANDNNRFNCVWSPVHINRMTGSLVHPHTKCCCIPWKQKTNTRILIFNSILYFLLEIANKHFNRSRCYRNSTVNKKKKLIEITLPPQMLCLSMRANRLNTEHNYNQFNLIAFDVFDSFVECPTRIRARVNINNNDNHIVPKRSIWSEITAILMIMIMPQKRTGPQMMFKDIQ